MVRDAMQPRLLRTDELVLDSFMPNSTALVTIIACAAAARRPRPMSTFMSTLQRHLEPAVGCPARMPVNDLRKARSSGGGVSCVGTAGALRGHRQLCCAPQVFAGEEGGSPSLIVRMGTEECPAASAARLVHEVGVRRRPHLPLRDAARGRTWRVQMPRLCRECGARQDIHTGTDVSSQ